VRFRILETNRAKCFCFENFDCHSVLNIPASLTGIRLSGLTRFHLSQKPRVQILPPNFILCSEKVPRLLNASFHARLHHPRSPSRLFVNPIGMFPLDSRRLQHFSRPPRTSVTHWNLSDNPFTTFEGMTTIPTLQILQCDQTQLSSFRGAVSQPSLKVLSTFPIPTSPCHGCDCLW
jgi:hypothetical protein